jgi:hypothetical protein
MKTLLLIVLLGIAGCTSTNKLQTGSYKVVTVKKFDGKSIVQLEGLKKEFVLPTDSLDKDEYVYITVAPDGK